ncbi:hypothetical protein JTB14_035774 [Gonioctena quinquepunctata]|nr:hypothetical protein JTB14_035774 [Gonioctena quinquepunctata]
MCSRKVRLADLKVAELKQELEERELETTGKKQVLQERLADGLIQEGEDPETFLFEVPGGDLSLVMNKLEENARSLEEKFLENTEGLKKELCGVAKFLEERMGTVETEIDKIREQMNTEVDKIKETISKLEKRINSAPSTEMVNENAMLDSSLNLDKVQEGIKDVKVISEIGKLSMKPPQFDGKTPWKNYRRQFEAAAKANGWNAGERAVALTLALRGEATNILQTLTAQEQEDYDQLIKHLELRYGQAHLEHFYKYVYGRRFLLRTDHAALKWLLQFKNPEGQVARWIERLQEFDFEIEHRAGTSHKNADALSRRPCPDDCSHCRRAEEKEATLCRTAAMDDNWNDSKIQKDQERDPDLGLVVSWKKGNHGRKSQVTRRLPILVEEDPAKVRQRFYWARKCAEIHDGVAGGHLGVTKTLQKVRQRFYWANCQADVQDWCRKCAVCAASNGPRIRPKAPMRQYNVGSPFERIAIDIAGPFPVSDHGNKYILVAMDYFSKWAEAYALPNQEAITVADVLVKEWICRFGIPMELHSDQGRNFESNLFQEICLLLNIRKTRTTALHPQSDGMVERMNRTINRHLSKVVSDHQRDWDQYLHLFLMAYRSAVHESTGQTPASIIMGRELRLPCDLKFGIPPGQDTAGEDYVSKLRQRMDDIHERVG